MLRGVDWEANGFGPVLETKSAEEAIAILSRQAIDVLVTDIRMPGMDGIQLVEKTRECCPETKVIVVSGYSEFEYARALMKLHVRDYILKPFRSSRLVEILTEVKARIEEEETTRQQLRGLLDQLERHRASLAEKTLLDALRRPWSVEADLSALGVEFTEFGTIGLQAAVVVVDPPPSFPISRTPDDRDRGVLQAIERFVEEKKLPWKALLYQPRQVAVVVPDSPTASSASMHDLLEHLKTKTAAPVTIGIGKPSSGLTTLWRSFQEASAAAGLSYVHGSGSVYEHSELYDRHVGSPWSTGMTTINEICSYVRDGAFGHIREKLDELFTQMQESALDRPVINAIASSLILATRAVLSDVGPNLTDLGGPGFDPISSVQSCKNIEELKDFVLGFFRSIELHAKNERQAGMQDTVAKIRGYIDENFQREITLESLARRFRKSPSYISALLSEHLGHGFSSYLSSLRIRRAVQLLRYTDLRVYEIAERVGFRDAYYFSARFKYLTGMSPTECRNSEVSQADSPLPQAL